MIGVWVAIAVAVDGLAGLAGALIPDRLLARVREPMLGFAAGAILASGIVEMIPDAWRQLGPRTFAWLAGAIALLAAIEHVSARHAHHGSGPVAPFALLASDALHNVGDGMAIAAAFLLGTRIGVITAAAVIVHEVPEEVADYALLRSSGVSRRRALLALVVIQLTAAVGAAGTLLASSLMAQASGVLLAISAGTFIHIGGIDLLPALLRAGTRSAFIGFALGAGMVVLA